jgi:hypothetical protein
MLKSLTIHRNAKEDPPASRFYLEEFGAIGSLPLPGVLLPDHSSVPTKEYMPRQRNLWVTDTVEWCGKAGTRRQRTAVPVGLGFFS